MLRLDRARDEHEGRARYHVARGVLHIRKQESAEAEAAFQEAARREPDSPDAHLALGTFYLMTRELEKAESEFDQVAEVAPTRSEAQIRVVDFYRLLGRTEEANNKLDRLVEEAPNFRPAWQRIAAYSFADEDFDRCEKALNHLLRKNPKNPEALQIMANLHRLRGEQTEATERFREAIAVVQDIVQRRPDMISARLRLAQMHIRLGETEQARTALQTIRELVPNSSAAVILVAELDVYARVWSASGIPFRYARDDCKKHQNTHTLYLTYEGPLPAAAPREVKVDITISERFVLPFEERVVLRGYDEYADLAEDSKTHVYSLEEIGVEKVAAVTDRARNEPRDLYDLWYLTSEEHIDLTMLMAEIESKLEFRGRSRDTMGEEFEKKEARYKKLWTTRLGSQMAVLPPFEDVFRAVRRSLRAAGMIRRP